MMLLDTVLLAAGAFTGQPAAADTVLGVDGSRFTVNAEPCFLLGISYYGALGASDEVVAADLDDMQRHGLNWLRVWATWHAFDQDVSTVDGEGRARPESLRRLEALVAECDRRGMVVDITLSRGNGVSGPPRLGTLEWHSRAVETLIDRLHAYRNWYLDLSNERNIRDARYTSFEDLRELRARARQLCPELLVTASQGGDIGAEEVAAYATDVGVDFLAPHRPRHAGSPAETEARTRDTLGQIRALGRDIPVHYQEPFRRGYGDWEPSAADFLADLAAAVRGGAAGWCLHNGSTRGAPDERPRRSFDLREGRLFDQLDAEEQEAVAGLAGVLLP
jgi:hypothetical protein